MADDEVSTPLWLVAFVLLLFDGGPGVRAGDIGAVSSDDATGICGRVVIRPKYKREINQLLANLYYFNVLNKSFNTRLCSSTQ